MDYPTMIKALKLDKETAYRIKDKILPEVWVEIEKYFKEVERWIYS